MASPKDTIKFWTIQDYVSYKKLRNASIRGAVICIIGGLIWFFVMWATDPHPEPGGIVIIPEPPSYESYEERDYFDERRDPIA